MAAAAVTAIAAVVAVAMLQPWSNRPPNHRAAVADASRDAVHLRRSVTGTLSIVCSSSNDGTQLVARWTTNDATDVTVTGPGGPVDAGPAGTLVLGQPGACEPGAAATRYTLRAVGRTGRVVERTVVLAPHRATPTTSPTVAPTTTAPSHPTTPRTGPLSKPGSTRGPSTTTTTRPAAATTTSPTATLPPTPTTAASTTTSAPTPTSTTTQPPTTTSTSTTTTTTTTTTLPVIQ